MVQEARVESFEVRPIAGALGAEIYGVDLSADPGDDVFAEIRDALHRNRVLAIRDQELSPAALHRLARRFGPFSGNPIHVPLDGFNDIVKVVHEPDHEGPVFGENWHMDLAWFESPPAITLLYAETTPPAGGDTLFADLHHAYEALSDTMKRLLSGLVGIHSGRGTYATNAALTSVGVRESGFEASQAETEHPVVCTHPDTGRDYLFISAVMRAFKGMTEEESRPIIDFLLHHAVRPEFTCRLRWSDGTLGIWENSCLLHAAINDYAGHRRVVYRTTVQGPRPRGRNGG